MTLSDKDRDRLIEAAEQLKVERAKETCRRAVVLLQGREWAPGRFMRDRYFLVNIAKASLSADVWVDASRYVNDKERFPLFFEMAMSLKYEPARVCHFIDDSEIEEIGG